MRAGEINSGIYVGDLNMTRLTAERELDQVDLAMGMGRTGLGIWVTETTDVLVTLRALPENIWITVICITDLTSKCDKGIPMIPLRGQIPGKVTGADQLC